MPVSPVCGGANCPIAAKCFRYSVFIDTKKDIYLSDAPYDHVKQKCSFFRGVNLPDSLSKRIETLTHGEENNDRGSNGAEI